MIPVFGYVRVSDPKQIDGASLDAQKSVVEAYANANGFVVSRWFVEQRTAAKQGRPKFDDMITELQSNKAKGFVVHKFDRSARNWEDWGLIGRLADAGYEIHSATEGIDFKTRGGRLVADVQMAVSVDFIRNQKQEIEKGMRGRLEEGLWPWGAPIGYKNNGRGKLKTPIPRLAPLCTETFELYATGQYSYRTLTKEMKRRGLTTNSGGAISIRVIENMLHNPFYCGVLKVRSTGETFAGRHQPLVSTTMFERVQDLIAGKSGKKITRHNHTYRGLFKCAHCLRSMIPEKQKGRVYYRCKSKGCPTKTVREDMIEAAIKQKFGEIGFNQEKVNRCYAIVNQWIKQEKAKTPTTSLNLNLEKIENRITRLTNAMLDGTIDHDEYLRHKEKLIADKQLITERQRKLPTLQAKAENLSTLAELILSHKKHYEMAQPHVQRHIVELDTSNRLVAGKDIYLEPSDYVRDVAKTLDCVKCEHFRDKSRTGDVLKNCNLPNIEELPVANCATTKSGHLEQHS